MQNVRPALLVLLGAVGAGAADRVRERRQPAARARRRPAEGDCACGRRSAAAAAASSGSWSSRASCSPCLGGAAGVLLASWGVSLLMTHGDRPAARTGDRRRLAGAAVRARCCRSRPGSSSASCQRSRRRASTFAKRSTKRAAARPQAAVRHHRMRSALVVAEIALALVLLVGAGLMLRSFVRCSASRLASTPPSLLVIDLPLSPTTYREDLARTTMVERVVERVSALPGVAGAAMATGLPMSGGGATIHFNIAGRPPKGPGGIHARRLSRRHARVLRDDGDSAASAAGRSTDRDRQGAPLVGVINESMARQYFVGIDPIGQRFADRHRARCRVAVHRDRRRRRRRARSRSRPARRPSTTCRTAQYPASGARRHVSQRLAGAARPTGDPTALVPSVRAALQEIDRDQPLVRVRTMEQAMGDTVAQPRLQALLLDDLRRRRRGARHRRRLRRDGLRRVAADAGDWRARRARRLASATSCGWSSAQAARLAALGIAIGLARRSGRDARDAEPAVRDERPRSADVRRGAARCSARRRWSRAICRRAARRASRRSSRWGGSAKYAVSATLSRRWIAIPGNRPDPIVETQRSGLSRISSGTVHGGGRGAGDQEALAGRVGRVDASP